MLVAGFFIGLAWYLTGMVGFIYWSNYFQPDLRGKWTDDELVELIVKSILGPVNWIIGYLAYLLK